MDIAQKPLRAPITRMAITPGFDARQRYYSLDFLRGALMLLGIVFHSALPYARLSGVENDALPASEVLGYVVVGSHGFRMPLFFILAGFFAALLYSRRTPSRFVVNRVIHIALPLLVGWAVLSPFVGAGFAFSIAAQLLGTDFAFDLAWELTKRGNFFFINNTMHLWFLYYLLFFYAVLLLIASFLEEIPEPARERMLDDARRLMTGRGRLLILGFPTVGLLYIQPMFEFATPLTFTPDVSFLVLFGAFFGFGVLLYAARDVLDSFRHGAWLYLAGGFFLTILYKIAVERWLDAGGSAGTWKALVTVANALMIWSLFIGIVGILLRYLDRPIPAVRYVADASFWCYLIHLSIVAWLPGLLARQSWSPELKFAVVVCSVTVICFATYELFVRWTFLGTMLQGRRYPSTFRTWQRRATSRE
jgi:glucans biosynthesis protein C